MYTSNPSLLNPHATNHLQTNTNICLADLIVNPIGLITPLLYMTLQLASSPVPRNLAEAPVSKVRVTRPTSDTQHCSSDDGESYEVAIPS
jgi:hypothetical protein